MAKGKETTHAILIGDIHLKKENLEVASLFFEELKKVLSQKSSRDVIFMGDVFDAKGIIRVEVQNFFFEKITEISKLAKSVKVLVGNHDMVGVNHQEHALKFLAKSYAVCKNVEVIESPKFLDIGEDGAKFLAMPYFHSEQEFLQAIEEKAKELGSEENFTVFCHQEFSGFCYNGSKTPTKGPNDAKIHSQVKAVFSGHIHERASNGRIHYVGTPFSHNFGEANSWNGLIDLHFKTLTAVPIELPQLPKHYVVRLGVVDELESVFEDKRKSFKKSDFLRLVISGNKEECLEKFSRSKIQEFLSALSKSFPLNFSLKYEFSSKEKVSENKNSSSKSLLDYFKEYSGKKFEGSKFLDNIQEIGIELLS